MNNRLVSVIIPHHDLSKTAYLKECLFSLANQNCNLEKIIVSDKEVKTTFNFCKIIEDKNLSTYAQKVNAGAEHATGTHILIAQDDLIFSRDCIKTMLEEMGDVNCMMNPVSNCDNENQFWTKLNFVDPETGEQTPMKQHHTLDEIRKFLPSLQERISLAPVWQKTSFLNTYCTLMPMWVWKKLGGYDENLRNCKEDIDLSLRAGREGIHMFINWNCFVLHFSGITANDCDLKEDNAVSNAYFDKKWANKNGIFITEQARLIRD